MTNAPSPGRRRRCDHGHGRAFVAAAAVLAVGIGGGLVTACGSDENSAQNELRKRLAATERQLPKDEVHATFQKLADAMTAAKDAGMSDNEILAEVIASNVRQWNRRGGLAAYTANDQALSEETRKGQVVTVPASSGQNDKPPRGSLRAQAKKHGAPAQPAASQEVVGVFANGIANTGKDGLAVTAALKDTLKQDISLAYNRSFRDAAVSIQDGRQSVDAIKDKIPDSDARDLALTLTNEYKWPGGGLSQAMGVDLFKNSLFKTVMEYAGSDAQARTNPAYDGLMDQGRKALNAGKPVVFICHSEGCFAGMVAKKDLDSEIAKAREARGEPPGPSPVGTLYIAPPFGNEGTETLSTGDSKYVLIDGDIIMTIHDPGVFYSLDPTTEAKPPQPTDAIGKHLMTTYLQDGSASRQQIIKAFEDLKKNLCRPVPGGGQKGRPGQEGCGVMAPQPSGPTESNAPGQPPGGPTESNAPGQPPGGPTESNAPGQPPGETPQHTPGQEPSEPGGQPPSTEEPPQTPEQPPGETPENPCCEQSSYTTGWGVHPLADARRTAPADPALIYPKIRRTMRITAVEATRDHHPREPDRAPDRPPALQPVPLPQRRFAEPAAGW
ncbi:MULTISPECIES: hypothetical protein [Streptomyces]|uniref:hypothetical protein n=1 Tax=Streptomyces TaxID=1883 RepID=UPI0034277E6C